MSLFSIERRKVIVDHARETGRADVAELSKLLKVSAETVRRDLNTLERAGLIRRVHGGAVPVERLGFESDLATRSERMIEEKSRIAEATIAHLENAEAIYVDEGTIFQLLADRIRPTSPLTVVSNSLAIASSLAGRPNVEVISLGGRVRAKTLGAVDFWAVEMLETMVLDLAIIGANGISVKRGATVPDAAIAEVKSAAMKQSRRSILIADHSKVGADSFVRFADLDDFELFITDDGVSEEHADELRGAGVELVLA
ncbi:DeoR/GlpR family DNA-binding transcription regulator [Gryllotalpicola ginsengisoli]|uniref:DeoR/GlpR family DNA-binding transcription regulator n=1 Tax=Gryllotalpicola ginsengisoli TaxID=444608 RepID=UPI0003B62218|nr:DeoR/GlpR family DNA-binding transcription regulator [Gryllotalpicola ginsengisoli]